MHIHELQQHIVKKELNKLYILTGEEVGIMDIYIDKMVEAGEYELVRIDTIQQAYSRMTQRRMVKSRRCFLVFNDKAYLKEDKIWQQVTNGVNESDDMLIIKYSDVDKRSKFYKTYKDEMVVFDKLESQMLASYIQQEIELTTKHAIQLAEICENDYNRCMLECDKIKHFYESGYSRKITDMNDSFKHLVKEGVIHQPIGDITFRFTDAIALRNKNDIHEYLAQAKAKNEPEIMVLSILYNTFKHILMVQGLGRDKTGAAGRTGLTGWQVNMAMNKLNNYTIGELITNLEAVRFAEKSIKTGQLDSEIALDYLLVNII